MIANDGGIVKSFTRREEEEHHTGAQRHRGTERLEKPACK